MKCRICTNTEKNIPYEPMEMMYGSREKFSYFQCSRCGCLQISEIPSDISRYYSPDYCSFTVNPAARFSNLIGGTARKLHAKYAVFNRGIIGKWLFSKYPNAETYSLSKVPVTKKTSILEVGCGDGYVLYVLSQIGFTNLIGIDPFIHEDIIYPSGLKILQKTIQDMSGQFDLVMLQASLEHIPDQLETLQSIARLLCENGTSLIRIPTVSSYAWDHYNVNWVQLDAPRHLYLHSVESMKMLVAKAGLRVEKIVYDSTDFQFWGSEQYLKGIALRSEQSYNVNPSKSIFSKAQIKGYHRCAERLNLENRGDMISFYLTTNR